MIEIINSYKPLIEIIANFVTLFAIIIAFYTLREIKKQRESIYKPELFLDTFCFLTLNNPFLLEHSLNSYRTTKYNERNKNSSGKEYINVHYKLENLGFGFAKSIECKWEFDYQKAFEELVKIMPKEYKFEKSLDNYLLLNELDLSYIKSFRPSDLEIKRIDFIQPSVNGKSTKKLVMPSIIVDSYLYFLLFKYNLTKKTGVNFDFENFKSMPKIKIKIKYKDLLNKTHYKILNVNIESACSQINDDNSLDTEKNFSVFYVNVKE